MHRKYKSLLLVCTNAIVAIVGDTTFTKNGTAIHIYTTMKIWGLNKDGDTPWSTGISIHVKYMNIALYLMSLQLDLFM